MSVMTLPALTHRDRSVLRAVGIDNGWAQDQELIEQTLWQIRFPRVLMSLLDQLLDLR